MDSRKRLPFDSIYCHTDSQISLSWIKATKKEFKPYVQNRVIEIRQKTKPENWFYCKTSDNPADFLTRADNNGINDPLWWNGPDYLKEAYFYDQDENVSPGNIEVIDDIELKEVKSAKLMLIFEDKNSLGKLINVKKYSDMMKLFRIKLTSFVL